MKFVKTQSVYLINEGRTRARELTPMEFEEIYSENCKVHDALEKRKDSESLALYRGSMSPGNYSFIDPSQYIRRSIENENIHVTFMSQDPSWNEFPKYERSLIGSTNFSEASMWGNHVFEVIPFDGAKIALCSGSDIWHSFGGFRSNIGIYKVTFFLNSLGIETHQQDDWDFVNGELKTIGKFSRDIDEQEKQNPWPMDMEYQNSYLNFIHGIPGHDEVTYDEVIEEIGKTFSPDEFHLIEYDMNYPDEFFEKINGYRQFFTDSKCLLRKV